MYGVHIQGFQYEKGQLEMYFDKNVNENVHSRKCPFQIMSLQGNVHRENASGENASALI